MHSWSFFSNTQNWASKHVHIAICGFTTDLNHKCMPYFCIAPCTIIAAALNGHASIGFQHGTSVQFGELLGTCQITVGIRCWVSESNMADLVKKERQWPNGCLVTLMAMQSSGFYLLVKLFRIQASIEFSFQNCLWSRLNLEIEFKTLKLLALTLLSRLTLIQTKEQPVKDIVINCKKLNSFLVSNAVHDKIKLHLLDKLSNMYINHTILDSVTTIECVTIACMHKHWWRPNT